LSFPAEQPGAERGDAKVVAQRSAAATPTAQSPRSQAAGTQAPGTPTTPDERHRAGVKSMFDL